MKEVEILVGREHIDPRLLMGADPSLARVMGQMNLCTCIAAMADGQNIAACLVEERSDGICNAVNFAVAEQYSDEGVDVQMIKYILGYAKSKNLKMVDIGAGNAHLAMHATLQRMGFRVIGVTPNYYQADGKSLAVENGIVNRDMIHYRADFGEGWTTWTEEVKSEMLHK